mmetsp:Transcript_9781/g.23895  ORF Transcript_9781/g.23895 Transcript_9781/m.23895 type:complete len:321 (+) Transcript_9781:440-1402(+)
MDPVAVRGDRRPDVRDPPDLRRRSGHDERQGRLLVDPRRIHHDGLRVLRQEPRPVDAKQAGRKVGEVQRSGAPRRDPRRGRIRRHRSGRRQAREGLRDERDRPPQDRPLGGVDRGRPVLRRRVRDRFPQPALLGIRLRAVRRPSHVRYPRDDREGAVRSRQKGLRLHQRRSGPRRRRTRSDRGAERRTSQGRRFGRLHQGTIGGGQRAVDPGERLAESPQHGHDRHLHARKHAVLRARKPSQVSSWTRASQRGRQESGLLKRVVDSSGFRSTGRVSNTRSQTTALFLFASSFEVRRFLGRGASSTERRRSEELYSFRNKK